MRILTALLAVLLLAPCPLLTAQYPVTVQVEIDGQAPEHPFPHFWEGMFGSSRATLSLRASYRHDLRQVAGTTDFRYVRFHGIFDDDTGFYSKGDDGKPSYNYSYIDQIYDYLVAHHIRPFVELDFMPGQLASADKTNGFWYRPNVSPPNDWNTWADMVQHFVQHLVNRYGSDEVEHWYFEVWNEPNSDFWAGNPRQPTYYHLYDVTARAVKGVDNHLRVGGPATSRVAWVSDFIRHCAQQGVSVDFVSTHVYGSDKPESILGRGRNVDRKDLVYQAVQKVRDEVRASSMPNLPIIISEYNVSSNSESDVTDSAFVGPWLANTIRQCDGLVKLMSFWTFSDVFEEQGVIDKPFYGGFGLIAERGIHKASFNDFALLHKLGTDRLDTGGDSTIVTRRPDGSLAIAVWNYAPPGNAGQTERVDISFKNVPGAKRAIVWVVDADHGSPLKTWKAMGSPSFPTREQIEILRQAGNLPAPQILPLTHDGSNLSITLSAHALAVAEVR